MYLNLFIYIYIYLRLFIYICMFIYLCVFYIFMCIYIYLCVFIYIHVNLYIFMYIYICMFINKFISWYKLRNISGSASNLCCIIDALLRFCNDDWCILSQIENVVVWIQNISHLTTMCTYIWISKEGCP